MPKPSRRIRVRFDLITRLSNRETDIPGFYQATIPYLPHTWEVINIKGDPYVIHERGWAIDDDTGYLHAYVRLLPCPATLPA